MCESDNEIVRNVAQNVGFDSRTAEEFEAKYAELERVVKSWMEGEGQKIECAEKMKSDIDGVTMTDEEWRANRNSGEMLERIK